MSDILQAFRRTLSTLSNGRPWRYILTPALVALLLLVILSLLWLKALASLFMSLPPISWLDAWNLHWLAQILAFLGGWLAILLFSYVLAVLLAAVAVMPWLLDYLAEGEYADVARRDTRSLAASVWNSIWSALIFMLGWLLTLPLWLIPGLNLALPTLWMAWLNRRTFAYEACSLHTTVAEWDKLRQHHAGALFLLGLLMALLAYVPVIGLLAPSLTALVYSHYCLEAVRRLRLECAEEDSLPGETS